MADKHCETCICGRRAPVQADRGHRQGETPIGYGSIAWAEHLEAYAVYSGKYGKSQTAERLAERGGFAYYELADLLGHKPTTWQPR